MYYVVYMRYFANGRGSLNALRVTCFLQSLDKTPPNDINLSLSTDCDSNLH